MAQRITQVDAFTDRRFAGNPAAVCVLTEPADPRWMQDVAAEMNLSETAFATRSGRRGRVQPPLVHPELGGRPLRPRHPGHGPRPLGRGAHRRRDQSPRFETRSGLLSARRGPDGIELDFPCEPVESRGHLARGVRLARGGDPGPDPLRRPQSVRHPRRAGRRADARGPAPRHPEAGALPARGVIVTSRSADPGSISPPDSSRRASGSTRIPVCGSAHCCLGPYWGAKLGKSALAGHPRSRRGGVVRVRLEGPRVVLIGHAVTVLRGELV